MAGTEFYPIGPERKTKGGGRTQKGFLAVKLEPFPKPALPPTGCEEEGWIVHGPREKDKLREADYDFRPLFRAATEVGDGTTLQRLNACVWYEYARECARVRTTAATFEKWCGVAGGNGRRTRYGARKRFPSAKKTFDWATASTVLRIDRARTRLAKWAEALNEQGKQDRAKHVLGKWKPCLETLAQGERAWSSAHEWLSWIRGKCSLGAPCLLTLAPWLAEDCPWSEIKCSKNPGLDVALIAIQKGPSGDDPFWRGGKGRHPIPGLTGGLQLSPGFGTVSPRSVFLGRTGISGEYLPDDADWTEALQFKEFRRERFVGEIVWNRPDSEILEDFAEWLKRRRSLLPEKFRNLAKRATRTRWDDPEAALRDLAALRLRAAFGPTAGSKRWAELYSPGSSEKSFSSGSIERQTRRAVADAKARFDEWLDGWELDSATA